MDSCHIFNFLFGTKRATTELSKCFTSATDCKRKLREDNDVASSPKTPPPSPLKQLQMKISSLAANTRRRRGPECDARCGTYRASLVQFEEGICERPEEGDCEGGEGGGAELVETPDEKQAQTANDKQREAKIRRVILYDEGQDEQRARDHERAPILASSAQVYNIVSTLGEARACLRRVGSISYEDPPEEEDEQDEVRSDLESASGKRTLFVRNLVQSIESKTSKSISEDGLSPARRLSSPSATTGYSKPITIVKPMPPKTPPKSNKAKCLNLQLSMNKPIKVQQLFMDETFLSRFFDKLEPIDRCVAAQVCRKWRKILYARREYWQDLVNVIDCTQLRREHLIECIINTLQSAKLKQQSKQQAKSVQNADANSNGESQQIQRRTSDKMSPESALVDFDGDEVWRIQELCNRFNSSQQRNLQAGGNNRAIQQDANNNNIGEQQQTTSKSSSIPSQISSTFSSLSLSSLLSPLSESSRVECLKEKIYASMNERGFDAICLFGASDDDIEDLVGKMAAEARARICICKLNNCSISNRGLESLLVTLSEIREIELSGCNEITNSFNLDNLTKLRRLTVTDCINIADGFAQKLSPILAQLDELTIQAYHLTDTFVEYLSLNAETTRLRQLELQNCKEITNQTLITLALHFTKLESLSISGSTKISDEGIEILAQKLRSLRRLDLSWCSRITDASLECIACDLGDSLTDLILDRNVHITDAGLGYLAMMSKLSLLYIRWCPRISDPGLETVVQLGTLRHLSLAGLHQITARSLLCLIETNLIELELTNCPAVNDQLLDFLASRMPKCSITV